ncbi:MAG: restriction endonuclease [Streptomycetaceae bacterium]|nr:restriction endonuclease [Streptomycetaceae bacterium]
MQVAERDGLLGAVAYAFVRVAERALRNGVLQGYRSVEDTLPVIRGRIRTAEQVRRHFGRAFPVEVAFEEFTEDIPENQVLYAAARRLLGIPGVPAACRPGLRRIGDALADVTDLEHGSTPPVLQWGAHNARFHGALRLAEVVLRGASYDLGDRGVVPVDGLLLNMEKVFEDFVGAALAEALRPYGGNVHTQDRRHFLDQACQIPMRPDVVWTRPDGRPAGVADAKYKLEKHSGYPNADVYQMTSYCLGLGLTAGHLIYAAGELPATRHAVRNSGIQLVRHAVPLDAEPGVLLAAMEQIAAEIAGAASAASAASRADA